MAGLFGIIKPQRSPITNLITNPSFEVATTGWTANDGATVALSRSSTRQRRGVWSLSIMQVSGSRAAGAYYSANLTSGVQYSFSVDIRDTAGLAFRIYFADNAGTPVGVATTWTGTGRWSRRVVTYTAASTATYRLYVIRDAISNSTLYHFDGAQLEVGTASSYFDGDSRDCEWAGTAHASSSILASDSREGGREVMLQDVGFYIDEAPGTGAPELTLHAQNYALLPGTLDQGHKIEGRTFSLVGNIVGTSIEDLHAKRKALFDLVKPDLSSAGSTLVVTYSGAEPSSKIHTHARYSGGMSFGTVAGFQDGYRERVALRFYADDPFWYEDGVEGTSTASSVTISTANAAVKFKDQAWGNLSSSFSGGIVMALAKKADGNIVVGGLFNNVGDTNGDYIVDYNPFTGAFSSYGTGINGIVNAVAVAANGHVYAGGNFLLAGGVPNTVRIAYWDTAAWNPLLNGIAGQVNALAFDDAGDLFIGGAFTDHMHSDGDYVTRWNGTAYFTLGSGMNNIVYEVKKGPDGKMYFGGVFTTGNGVLLRGIGRWNGTTFEALGGGVLGGVGVVYAIAFDDAGNMYIGGNFTSVDGIAALNVAMFDGSKWHPLGDGVNNTVNKIAIHGNLVYFTGMFTEAGGVSLAERMAIWNGSTWAHMPVALPGAPAVYALLIDDKDLYIGYDTSGTAFAAKVVTLTNAGTAVAYPKLVIKRSAASTATVAYIKNETTGATVWLNYTLQVGETLTLDFSPTSRSVVSNYRGNVIGVALLRNSDFAGFSLLPGDNAVSIYVIEGTIGATLTQVTWPITHWSLDGSAL